MPTYIYRAVDKTGTIVKNKVEEGNRLTLLRKLKSNGLYPIAIVQRAATPSKASRKKRNVTDIQEVLKNVNTTQIGVDKRTKMNTWDKVNTYFSSQQKVTSRDLVIFAQNFYLLKKANFNNVHALATIIESTENLRLVAILEDILAGVEAGDYMYKTMEYYSDVFPYIFVNMIRVGELSGSLENSLMQAVEYLDNSNELTHKLRGILILKTVLEVFVVQS